MQVTLPSPKSIPNPGLSRERTDIPSMQQLPGLNEAAFDKIDRSSDLHFYSEPRFVTHIDERAIAAVTAIYAEVLPRGGAILDLMSSWVSHLPDDVAYSSVVGHGMNCQELAGNERLSEWFIQNLNEDPLLPLANGTFDAASLCVSVQYLQRPVDVFREIARVLRPGSPFVVSFSNRCFPTKAIAIWRALSGPKQQALVGAYMMEAGFIDVSAREWKPSEGDPLWVVLAKAPPEHDRHLPRGPSAEVPQRVGQSPQPAAL